MGKVNPSLFSALGRGFADDEYAVDGNHLRWQFDRRLGFPRLAVCVDVRPSVVTMRVPPQGGIRFADLRVPSGGAPVSATREVISALEVTRRPEGYVRTAAGVVLDGRPVRLQFTGTDAYACMVRLTFTVAARSGSARVEAWYRNRGVAELVDVAVHRRRRVLDDIDVLHDLLDRPVLATRSLLLRDRGLFALHRRLVAIDAARFSRVSAAWLQDVAARLDRLGITPDRITADLSVPVTVALVVSSARIDELTVTGSQATLQDVRWVRSEDLVDDGRWKEIGCFPAATTEDRYVELNKARFAGRDPMDLAKERALRFGPVGAEPLDEPQVPPVRPATDAERAARYLQPWTDRLEPWLRAVFSESAGGGKHQSEVTVRAELDDAGQRRGAGVPPRLQLQPPTMAFRPYDVLVAAGLASFPTARLLGMGCVHEDPGTELLDYRVRGRWLVEDLLAWVQAVQRQVQERVERLLSAPSPVAFFEVQDELFELQTELAETAAFVSSLVATAVDGVVELYALVVGVQMARRPMFAPPASVTVADDGRGLPPEHATEAIATVSWALRQRARVVDDTAVPTGACIARSLAPSTGRFDGVRNPNDPADDSSPPVAVVPAGPDGAPGAAGTASFSDRYVGDGVTYRYGVSECDPFGRWSAFTETTFRWDDLTPPAPPAQVRAELDEAGAPLRQRLQVAFAWALDQGPLSSTTFEVHVRRSAPPSGAPVDRAPWGRCERLAGSGATAFLFSGSFTGTTAHDGMAVTVGGADETRTTPLGPRAYRLVTVELDGVVVPYDAGDRARAWVAIGTVNGKGIPSEDLGGPAMAEHIRVVPPPPPVYPPEPLLATFPDADRRSTFTVTWTAAAGQRAVVYKAGERDLMAMAAVRGIPTTWAEDQPAALRAAAVKQVAPQLRDAFQPVGAALPPGTTAHTVDLPGTLTTLTFFTVVGQSPALVPGPWPSSADGFVAVAVPRVPEPARPVVLAAVPTGAGGVEVTVAEPPTRTAAVASFELVRVRAEHHDRAADWRRMRPAGRFAVDASSFVDVGGGRRGVRVVDDDALVPWTAYLYRVVARGPDGGRATRSEPSAAVRVVTVDPLPPPAPVVTAVVPAPGGVAVTWTATAPATPAGPFRFEVRDPSGPLTLALVDADEVRDPTDPSVFSTAVVVGGAAEVVVVVTDPVGRRTGSAPFVVP